MILSNHDIEIIEKFGYDRTVFSENHHDWIQLKNIHGRCVFHDGNKCTIYEHRPEGCKLYPVVYDKDNHRAILDLECPQKQCFPIRKPTTEQLYGLISTLEHERTQRQHTRKKS
jgi:uncharacterized protein